LARNLHRLIDGTALRIAQCQATATHFGARTPEDGRIDWTRPAAAIHNLVRGVAPPYPGAFTCLGDKPARVLRTLREPGTNGRHRQPFLFFVGDRCYAQCGDAALLRIAQLDVAGELLQEPDIAGVIGDRPLPLPIATRENA
jgi:methionyl-tRNA formyltransferase